MNIKNRTLFIADNLDILRGINGDCIDLIYLDPPFNSKKEYKAPIGSPAEGAAFKDIWTDEDIKNEWHGQIAEEHEELYQIIQAAETLYDKSMKIYLMAMAVRLFEMRRILKPTGSVYLHCDPTASHYIKMVMDSIFGHQNFRNEIVWCYTRMSAKGQRQLSRAHDTILWYSMGSKWRFNVDDIRLPYAKGSKAREGHTLNRLGSGYSKEGITKLNPLGKFPEDWMTHIPYLRGKERTGWPTQKPLKLLERIVKASSNKGDIVLDPFCGCATACVAAEQLERQWIGIDISPSAETITKVRLEEEVEKKVDLFNAFADVTVLTEPPIRTDLTETATQTRLPKAHSYKHELYGQQEGRCIGCNYYFPFRNMTIDHIIPQSKGGTDHKANLQLLCNACNSTKGTRSQSEFIAALKEQNVRTER